LYYTVNGPDPRVVGGGVHASALTYAAAVPVSGWTATVRARVKKGTEWSALNEAVFVRSTAPPPIRITEIMAAPAGPSAAEKAAGFTDKDDFEFLEITNTGSETVNLRDMRFSQGVDLTFYGDVFLTAGERVVVVRSRAAFQMRYGAGPRIVGEFVGTLDDGGERLALLSALGATVVDFSYDNDAPWPQDLGGRSLVLRGATLDPANAGNWRPSVTVGGNPTTVDSLNYAAWKTAHGVVSETADIDHDGLLPLVEYASGGLPTVDDTARNPRVSVVTLPEIPPKDYLLISIRRQRGTDDLALTVEKSGNLLGWAAAAIEPYSSTPLPDGTDLEVWKVLPAVEVNPVTFLRVRWTQMP
jgi:hypothetical protein